MKNTIVWSWSKDPSILPIESLIQERLLNVVFWATRQGKKTQRTKHFSYIPELMLKDMAEKEKCNFAFYNKPISSLSKDINKFMDIYSRVNYSKGLDYFDHINLFHLYYNYFFQIFLKQKVELVIFFCPPHVGVDFILYLVAQSLKVPTLVTIQSHVPNRFYCVTDIADYGKFKTSPVHDNFIENLSLPKGFEKYHFYMEKKKNSRDLLAYEFLKDIFYMFFQNRQPVHLSGTIQKQIGRSNYKKYYKKQSLGELELDFSKKYVYFPLQLQPEMTTSILAEEFSDQILAIEKISLMLSEDWFIYVKENPKQGHQQRNTFFYERLSRIKNCVYLKDTVDTYRLMRSCQFVATITGTAGWESISGGKNALIFGNTWYESLPGVIRYKDGISLSDIMNISFTYEDLYEAYRRVMGNSFEGIVDVEYKKLHKNYNIEDNAQLIKNFLRQSISF